MAGYGIVARIDGVRPRFAALDGRATETDRWPAFDGTRDPLDRVVPLAEPGTPTLAERLERGREVWAQTTFFLFDPNSWR